MLRPKHLMNAAMSLPQNHFAALQFCFVVAAERIRIRIPQRHLVERDPHPERRVAAQMLIGKEHHAARPLKRPLDRRLRIARRANDPAMPADKRLETRRRVDVRHWRQVFGVDHLAQLLPSVLNLLDSRHVRHRAAGRQVGQDHRNPLAAALGHFLRPVRQDVGRLSHEVDAAKRNRPAILIRRRQLAEPIAVARQVGQCNHFVLLIVMAQDQEPRPELVANRLNPRSELTVLQRLVRLKCEGRRRRGRCKRHLNPSSKATNNEPSVLIACPIIRTFPGGVDT